jgi:DUF4097 and DUF4098 domain-containing protein YvlB
MTCRSLAAPALLVALVLAAPATVTAQRQEQTVERTLTVQPGGTLRLKTFSGRVDIRGGSVNQVVIKAVRRATADRLRDITLEITQSGNTVEIDANHRQVERRNENVVETDFDIQVPREMTLDLRTFSAPVTVTAVSGRLQVDGFSSRIALRDVSGPTRVKTFSGEVEVAAESWTDGDDVDITTFSGDVRLRLPGNARGALNFDSFSGRFDSDLPVTLQSSSRRNFRGELNGGGNTDFRLKTFSGSVTIQK